MKERRGAGTRRCMPAVAGILVCGMLAGASPAAAQPFPAAPVRIVIPYPVSGPTDINGTTRLTRTYKAIAANAPPPISDTLARVSQRAIAAESPHPVVLERRPGGVTTRGATAVARAAPDGHTLLLASNATMVINPNYFHGVEYDPARDFVLVAPLATMPFVLMVAASVPADTVPTLAAWLRVRPGEVNYGSSGDGSVGQLAGELFRRALGADTVHVPYNGGLAALNGMAQGQVSLVFAALPLAMHYLASDYFRPLAITGERRFELVPALPTLAESGLSGFAVEGWFGVFGPARMPSAAASWLNGRIAAGFAAPETRAALLKLGLEPATGSPTEFASRMRAEHERWGPVMRASRLPLRDRAS